MNRNKQIWRLMEAKCNEAEIAAYFGTTELVARMWMFKAKRWAYGVIS
jgi:hypothetical protein